MNYAIQNLNYENRELRMMEIDGEPWWVAKDVCDILDHSNPTVALEALDDDERTKVSLGRGGETNVVNEAGLYHLILKSKTAAAKTFRRWVTHKVLPQIRRTGVFMAAGELAPEVAELVSLEYRLAAVKKRLEARELDCKARLVYRLDGAVPIMDWLKARLPKLNAKQLANESRSIKRALAVQLHKPTGATRRIGGGKVISALPADIQAAFDLLKTTRKGLK